MCSGGIRGSGPPADKPQEQGSDAMQVDVPKEEVDPLRDMLDDAAEQDDDKALAAFKATVDPIDTC